jgi:hypothetical protein
MVDDYAADNTAERKRLFALTSRWTEVDLSREMPNGWTVATKLAHLAFWDEYYLARIEQWERTGLTAANDDVEALTHAVRQLSGALSPKAAVTLVRAAAEAIDTRLTSITPKLRSAIEASGRVRLLHRALHRREHLDDIERVLGSTRTASSPAGR